MQPVIKWSGSKRSQAEKIISYFPDYDTYYEPFIGGGSIMYHIKGKRVCSDICKPLIDLWQIIQNNPLYLIKEYETLWNELQEQGQEFYYSIRDKFNQTKNPAYFLFLSRTCTNGLIRFNKKGEFNNSYHHGRKGIKPDKLHKIMIDWSNKIQNVIFVHQSYEQILHMVKSNDFVYLDPPYFNTKGMYYGTINYEEFINFLKELNNKKVKFALSYDGIRGNTDRTVELPKDIYVRHEYIKSGLSSFNRLRGNTEEVYESLYLNYE